MITFTVPQKLRRFIRSHQRICYSALFRASSGTIKKLAADKKYIGGDLPGFLGVLHTWGRQLVYHPHIHYVVPYVFKFAISNSRIIKVENHKVFFKYKKPKSNRWRIMVLDIMEFMRRFLQHVLPTGFMKVRYYGFLATGSSVSIEKISALIDTSFGFVITKPENNINPFHTPVCNHCGGKLKYVASIITLKLIRPGPQ